MRRTCLVLCLLLAAVVAGGGSAQAATSTKPAPSTSTKPAPSVAPSTTPLVKVIQTSTALGQDLAPVGQLRFSASPTSPHLGVIHVQDQSTARYQRIVGVGAAMTDTSAWLLFQQLPSSSFHKTMEALFGRSGIHLSFLRVPMGASDFSAEGYPYTYDDIPVPGSDPGLKDFSIGHDRPYIIPALQEAMKLNPYTQIVATPWTPPRFMKTNDNFDNTNNGALLLPSMYGPLANYFVKFIKAYAAAKIPITAITPQNEPGQGTWYPGLNLPDSSEAVLIANYLKPALVRAKLKTQVFGFDSSWAAQSGIPSYVRTLIDSASGRDLQGIAFHCYDGSPNVMSALHSVVPRLQQWVTECTTQTHPTWFPAELEIASLRNWASAVGLWNLALDPAGGPVQQPNTACMGCTGVVTVDEATHSVSFGLPYFQLGQVSKFLEPGAVRIYSNHFVTYSSGGPGLGLDDVAFLNPDGTEALVAYNNTTAPVPFGVQWHGKSFTYTLPAGAMATFDWRAMKASQAPKAPRPPTLPSTPKKKSPPAKKKK